MLPGVGTFFGGLINGTVAASITFAIGTAVSEICAVFSEKVIDGNTKEIKAFLDNMGGFFTEQVMKNFERK